MSDSFLTRTLRSVSAILEPLGLYQVNDAYLQAVNDGLTAAGEEADAVEQDVRACGEIVDAIAAEDLDKAVALALEYLEIDDEVAELKDIRTKVDEGEVLEAVVAAKDAPALVPEMVRSTTARLEEAAERTEQLLRTLVETAELAAVKVRELPSAASEWSLAEKLGTPEAVKNTADKAREAEKEGRELKDELESLASRIRELQA